MSRAAWVVDRCEFERTFPEELKETIDNLSSAAMVEMIVRIACLTTSMIFRPLLSSVSSTVNDGLIVKLGRLYTSSWGRSSIIHRTRDVDDATYVNGSALGLLFLVERGRFSRRGQCDEDIFCGGIGRE